MRFHLRRRMRDRPQSIRKEGLFPFLVLVPFRALTPQPRLIPLFLRENQGGLFSAEYRPEEQSLTMRHLKGDRGYLAAAKAFSPQGQDFSFLP